MKHALTLFLTAAAAFGVAAPGGVASAALWLAAALSLPMALHLRGRRLAAHQFAIAGTLLWTSAVATTTNTLAGSVTAALLLLPAIWVLMRSEIA